MNRRSATGITAFALAIVGLPAAVHAQGAKESSPEAIRFFETKVRPVLAENCFKCHGPEKQKGHLRLDGRAAILEGGELGPAIVAGDPEKSLVIKAIRQTDPDFKMPPSGKLTREQIDDLTRWVAMGAPWPGSDKEPVKAAKKAEKEITEKDREHWAYRAINRPAVPTVKNHAWVANPIDAFIAAKLEEKGLHPNPAATNTE